MTDLRPPRKTSRRLFRLVASLAIALTVLLSTATAVGASPNSLMSSIGLGARTSEKKLGVVVLGSRVGFTLGDSGLDHRHLAHQRRPAFVASAISAIQAGLAAVEEVLAPIVGASPVQPPAADPQPDPTPTLPVEVSPTPEEPPAPRRTAGYSGTRTNAPGRTAGCS